MMTYQLLGAVAIVVGLVGTWFAARSRRGWLLCIASTVLWLPALTTGGQWTAVGNCALSIGICLRNFLVDPARTRRTSTSRRPSRGSDQDGSWLHEGMAAQNQAPGSPANAADATAFPYSDGGWAGVIVGVDPDPANAGLITRWAQDYWRDLHPNAAGGGYV